MTYTLRPNNIFCTKRKSQELLMNLKMTTLKQYLLEMFLGIRLWWAYENIKVVLLIFNTAAFFISGNITPLFLFLLKL